MLDLRAASPRDPNKISVDAALVAVLSELDNILTFKENETQDVLTDNNVISCQFLMG